MRGGCIIEGADVGARRLVLRLWLEGRRLPASRVSARLVLAMPRCLRLDNGTHLVVSTVRSVAR